MSYERGEERAHAAGRAARTWARAQAASTSSDVLDAIHRHAASAEPDDNSNNAARPLRKAATIEPLVTDESKPSRRRLGRTAVLIAAATVALIAGFVIIESDRSDGPRQEPTVINDIPPTPTNPSATTPVQSTDPSSPFRPTETTPRAVEPVLRSGVVVGDAATLDAVELLNGLGLAVNASASRTFAEGLTELAAMRDERRLGDVVVVQLGSNGAIAAADLDRAAAILADVPAVVFVTHALPDTVAYRDRNNELIRALPEQWPNISVLDWAVEIADCPGNCVRDDQLRLLPDGQEYLARLVEESISAAGSVPAPPAPSEVAAGALPDGFKISTAGGRTSFTMPPAGVFHGVAHGIDEDGFPTAPVVHVRLANAPTERVGERVTVDNLEPGTVVTRWDEPLANPTTETVEVAVPVGDLWVTVSGHDDVDLLSQIAATVEIADGSVEVAAPDPLVWNPGRSTVGMPVDGITYLGPELATLRVSTMETFDGVFIDALRLGWLPEWFDTVDGMPAVVIRDERGLGLIQVQTDERTVVTIGQSSPQSTSNTGTFPLDEDTMLQIARSLTTLDTDEWEQLRARYETPQFEAPLPPGGQLDEPIETLSPQVPIPVTNIAGPDGTNNALIAIVPGSSEPRIVVENNPADVNTRPIGTQLLTGRLLEATPSGPLDPDGTPVIAVVTASPDAGAVVLTNGDARIDVEVIEAFPNLLPGRLIGYIEVTEPGYRLEAANPDAHPVDIT